ncbi:RAD55 family ATPase [Candidatus Hecatella orcuttiae]|jgi:non-specific serine/threonine protein kinase|uniref:RAD55 family ATPase n=1 Tax=Candidatus Hecatella orcuttiae TaxID=1935119 RepID=UPI0028682E6F|nr:ATPase domain-containing protein [Candidatus Hecatella orcuttiae]
MAELIKTGVEGLDDVLGGGLPDKSLVLVLGETGSHYDTFVRQIFYNHVLEGGKVAYYIVETSSSDVLEDMSVYNWDLTEFMEKGSWVFVNALSPDLQELSELSPSKTPEVKLLLSQTLTTLKRDFLARVKEGRWTALHISHLILRYDFRDVMDTVLYMRMVVRHHSGLHFILLPRGVHEEQKIQALKHLADGVFEFGMQERGREYEGVFTITKLRKVLHKTKTHSFMISNRGLYIERAERIV